MALRVAGCMVWRMARRASSADAQRDLAEDVPALDPLLRLVRLRQREFRFDRHLEFRRLDGAVQPLELLHAGNGVEEFQRLNRAIEAAKLKVPIEAEFPLAQADKAQERVEGGHILGKITLRIR